MPGLSTNKKTPLYALHRELGARLVAFAGYAMPVQYRHGIRHEHTQTRSRAGLFDISHMGQIRIFGDALAEALEALVPTDIAAMQRNRQCYTMLTNAAGGIIDDVMLTRRSDHLFMVLNAACRDKDIVYLRNRLEPACRIEVMDDHALLALQGPGAAGIMERYISDISELKFMHGRKAKIAGINCYITRSGYTGEDGFECSVKSAQAEALARTMLSHEEVEAAGLGARDTLRLEAGLCLYGHDIDEQTTPVEASLGWVVAKKYQADGGPAARFPGAERILLQLRTGTNKVRTGFRPEGRIPVRGGTIVLDENHATVGRITSGGFAQTAGGPVAMGYIHPSHAVPGTELQVVIRAQRHRLYTTGLPFIKHRYYQN
jgi:aminomethyltransferase